MIKRFFILIILCLCSIPCPAGATEIALTEVVSGLNRPLFLTHAGDGSGRIFIVEQTGRIRILENESLLGTPFLDISSGFGLATAGERGLLGLAFHPDYDTNGRFFINYTRDFGQLQTVIQEHQVSGNPNAADQNGQVILTLDQPASTHNGGWLGFGPSDGYLYISSGDSGTPSNPSGRGQELSTLLGKILRIDVDSGFPYGIPADNPFVGVKGARGEIWAYGLRNPWRASFDPLTGRLFAADVGQNTWEEVNIVEGGKNYGWNIVEGPDCFEPPVGCDMSGMEPPIDFYGRSLGRSVTGGYVYRGQQILELTGDYVFGDYVLGRIWSLTEGPENWSRSELFDTALNISSFGVDEDGELYVVNHGGSVWRLTSTAPRPDLEIRKMDLGPFVVGTTGYYRLGVSNLGNAATTDTITVTDEMPDPLQLLSVHGPGWSCETNTASLSCELESSLEPGQSRELSVAVLAGPGAGPQVVNTATVSNSEDSNPDNNSGNIATSVFEVGILPRRFAQFALGDIFKILILVSNKGLTPWEGQGVLRRGNEAEWDSPWDLNGVDQTGSSHFEIALPPQGSRKYTLTGDAQVREGFFDLIGTDSSLNSQVAVSFFYQVGNPALTDSIATFDTPPSKVLVFPVEKSSEADTGFAYAALDPEAAFSISATLIDPAGIEIGTVTWNYTGHDALFFTERFDFLESFVGSLRIESEVSLYLTVFRVEQSAAGFQLTNVPPEMGY